MKITEYNDRIEPEGAMYIDSYMPSTLEDSSSLRASLHRGQLRLTLGLLVEKSVSQKYHAG